MATATKTSRRLLLGCVVGLAVGLLLYGGNGLWQRYRATHTSHPVITKSVITKVVNRPDETPPADACANYQVVAAAPKRIDIASIGAHGCIERVGLTTQNAIAAPDNIYTAAWYTRSVLPGQPGLGVILGHISGRYKTDGIFQRLGELGVGDDFTITLGSGEILRLCLRRNR